MRDDQRLVPDFQLVVDGAKADPELAGSVIGIRVTDDLDRASRFQVHLSDVNRKWTKSGKLKPGTAIEIKLGYQGQLKSVCKGEVATLEVVLTPDGPTRLVVGGVDKGHAFDQGTVTKTYQDVKDSDLARQIAQRHGLSADVDDSKVVHDFVVQNNLSDYDFLMQRAAIAGFRMYVDGNRLLFKKPKLGESPAATLIWKQNVGRLVHEVNTFDQVSKVTGTGWDPKTAKEIQGAPAKSGDENGKQGGTKTGAQLVKELFGEIEAVVPVASGQKNLLEAVAKSEFNRRAGAFVHAEARVSGDANIRAGAVVEVQKAGGRIDGQYYVVSTDHLFFVDTGYATELRAKRYTIGKPQQPAKDLAKLAKQVQEAAKQAEELAEKIEKAASWSLKAAREAAKRAQQALDAAKQVYDEAKKALDEVKKGAGDVAGAALDSLQRRLATLNDLLGAAKTKVNEAKGEAAKGADAEAKDALGKAHEAAHHVVALAEQAAQHARDAFDAAKAAALDAIHTEGGSPAVGAVKKQLLASAELTFGAAKAGLTIATAAIAKGRNAIEMCAARAAASAQSLVQGLAGDLSHVADAVKKSSDGAQQSLGAAIAAGAQHALDAAKDAIHEAQDAIASAKKAVEDAAKNLEHTLGDQLKGVVDAAQNAIADAKKSVDDLKQKFDDAKKLALDVVDRYAGKWIDGALYLKEHGKKSYDAGKSVLDRCKKALDLLDEKKWEDAEKEIEPAPAELKTCKEEAQLCSDKYQELEAEIPAAVKDALRGIVERLEQMLSQSDGTHSKTLEAIKAKVHEFAEQAKALYEKAKPKLEELEKDFEQAKDLYDNAKEAYEAGEKAWNESSACLDKCKEAKAALDRRDWAAAKKAADEAITQLDAAKKDAETCEEKANAAYENLPEDLKKKLDALLAKLKELLGIADETASETKHAADAKDGGAADAKATHAEAADAHAKLSKEHDAQKDKADEGAKAFASVLKELLGKLHQSGDEVHEASAQAVEKGDTAVRKSTKVQMSQARGAVDQIDAAHGASGKALDGAKQHGAAVRERGGRIPEIAAHVDGALASLAKAHGEGERAAALAKDTVQKHDAAIETEAPKLTQKSADALQRASAAVARAKEQQERNQALARGLPQRPGAGDSAKAAGAAVQSATAAAESAKASGGDARSAGTSACKVPDDEKIKEAALQSIAACESAAKKAEATADTAQKSVDCAKKGDTAGAQKEAGAAQGQQQQTAAASQSASAQSKDAQQSAAQSQGKREEPKPDAAPTPQTDASGAASAAPKTEAPFAAASTGAVPAATSAPVSTPQPPSATAPATPPGADVLGKAQGAAGGAAPSSGITEAASSATGAGEGAPGIVESAKSAADDGAAAAGDPGKLSGGDDA